MTTTIPSASDFLMGGGGRSCTFPNIGDSYTGAITATPEVVQQTSFESGELLYWEDGKPRMQLRVTLDTALKDDDDDDGVRILYIKGQMQQATRDAVRASGAKTLEVGGRLTVRYAGDGEAKGRLNPPKRYEVTYEPASASFLGATASPAPVTSQQTSGGGAASGGRSDNGLPPGLTPEQRQALLNVAPEQRPALLAMIQPGSTSQAPPF